MSVHDIQLGIAKETTYGTFVAPVRSYKISSMPSVKKEFGRIESPSWQAGQNANTAGDFFTDTTLPALGGLGSIPLRARGMGLLLQHIFGAAPTIGAVVSGKTPMTFVPSSHAISFTTQVNRPFVDTSGIVASYYGCKVTDAKFMGKVSTGADGFITCEANIVAKTEAFTDGLAAAAYASSTGDEPFTFKAVTLTVDGSEFCADGFEINIANNFRSFDQTRKFCSGGAIGEPQQERGADITCALTGADFKSASNALYTKLRSATAAGALCTLDILCTGVTDTASKIQFTCANARIDGDVPTGSGTSKFIDHPVRFKLLAPAGGGNALSVLYNSLDTAP
jgi:hypothetical protein